MFDYNIGDIPITDETGHQLIKGRRRQRKDRPVIRGKVYSSGFADDTCFYMCGTDLEEMQRSMQVVLDMASQWAEEASLKFSAPKTKAMIITRKRNYTKPPRLKLNGVELKYCLQVLYLGLWVDHKLTWKYHLAEKIKACKKLLMAFVQITGKRWGMSPWSARYYYNTMVKTSFCYLSLIWHHVCRLSTVQ